VTRAHGALDSAAYAGLLRLVASTPLGDPEQRHRIATCAVAIALAVSWGNWMASASRIMVIAVVAVIGGLVALPLMWQGVFVLYAILIATVPYAAWLQTSENGNTIVPLLGVMIAALWTCRALFGLEPVKRFKEQWYLLAMGGVFGASTWANWDQLFEHSQIFTHISLLVLTYLAVQMISTQRRLYTLGWILIITNTLAGIVTIAAGLGIANYTMGDVPLDPNTGVQRFAGITGGAAIAAVYCMIGIIFALNYLIRERNLFVRLVLVLCLVVAGWAMVYSYALTIWLSTAIACGLTLQRHGGINVKNALKATVIGGVIAGLVIAAVPGFQERIANQIGRFDTLPRELWFSRRLGLAEGAVLVTLNRPWLGVGPGHNKYYIPQMLPLWQYEKHGSHNSYLAISADDGVVALALFLLLFVGAIRGLGKVIRAGESGVVGARTFDPRLVRAVYCTLIALAVASFGDQLEREKYLWLMFGMAIAIRVWSPLAEDAASESMPRRAPPEQGAHAS
jgi:O-antigen ligase